MKMIKKKTADAALQHSAIIGTAVYANTGKKVGRVKTLYIDPETFQIDGLEMSTGMVESNTFVGQEYIESISESGVRLSIVPITELLGKEVLDGEGNKVGKVIKVTREGDSNEFVSLLVDRGVLSGDLLIARNAIAEIGDNVRLKTSA